MSSVCESARLAVENLIVELETEKQVSSKLSKLNNELIARLTQVESEKRNQTDEIHRFKTLVEELQMHIHDLTVAQQVPLEKDGKDDAIKDANLSTHDTKDTSKAMVIGSGTNRTEIKKVSDEEVLKEMSMDKESKAMVKVSDWVPIDSQPMSEDARFQTKVRMITRFEFRQFFGESFSNRCGHFVDHHMSKKIHSFAYWVDYPTGDKVLKKHDSVQNCSVISSDGYYLFVSGKNQVIYVISLTTEEVMKVWKAHQKRVTCLAYHPGLLVSSSSDKTLRVWNSYTYQLIHTLVGHVSKVYSCDINKDGTQIVSASHDRSIRLWSARNGDCMKVLTGHSASVKTALFVDQKFIVSASDDETIKIWDSIDGNEQRTVHDCIEGYNCGIWSNCDETLIAFLYDYGFTVLSWPELDEVCSMVLDVFKGVFHPSLPDIFAVDDGYHAIQIYNVRSGSVIRTLKGHTDTITGLCFTPDGHRLVSVSADKTTKMWNTSDLLE